MQVKVQQLQFDYMEMNNNNSDTENKIKAAMEKESEINTNGNTDSNLESDSVPTTTPPSVDITTTAPSPYNDYHYDTTHEGHSHSTHEEVIDSYPDFHDFNPTTEYPRYETTEDSYYEANRRHLLVFYDNLQESDPQEVNNGWGLPTGENPVTESPFNPSTTVMAPSAKSGKKRRRRRRKLTRKKKKRVMKT